MKNNKIELYRFFFAIIIFIFHGHNVNNGLGHPIPLGHVFVEAFFLMTGYFTYKNIQDRVNKGLSVSGEYPLFYTFKKLLKVLPYMIMTMILYYVGYFFVRIVLQGISILSAISDITGAPFELMLLQVTGICKNPHFNVWWYLSAILFALPLIIILFERRIKSGSIHQWIMYAVPIIIYGWFATKYNGLNFAAETGIFVRTGFIRGFAGLCLGGVVYELSYKISKSRNTPLTKWLLTITEVGCFCVSFLVAWKWSSASNSTFLCVTFLFIGLTLAFSAQSYTEILNCKYFGILGFFSVPLYISHYSVGRIVGMCSEILGLSLFWRYLLYYTISIIVAIMMLLVNNKFFNIKNKSRK